MGKIVYKYWNEDFGVCGEGFWKIKINLNRIIVIIILK